MDTASNLQSWAIGYTGKGVKMGVVAYGLVILINSMMIGLILAILKGVRNDSILQYKERPGIEVHYITVLQEYDGQDEGTA